MSTGEITTGNLREGSEAEVPTPRQEVFKALKSWYDNAEAFLDVKRKLIRLKNGDSTGEESEERLLLERKLLITNLERETNLRLGKRLKH